MNSKHICNLLYLLRAPTVLEELLKKGIEFFNRGYYFETYDVFEEIWMEERGEARIFYQGLVQVSTHGCP